MRLASEVHIKVGDQQPEHVETDSRQMCRTETIVRTILVHELLKPDEKQTFCQLAALTRKCK